MGIGPVPAIKAALNKADKSLQHMELIEVLLLNLNKVLVLSVLSVLFLNKFKLSNSYAIIHVI